MRVNQEKQRSGAELPGSVSRREMAFLRERTFPNDAVFFGSRQL
jgi:hypothetical protein